MTSRMDCFRKVPSEFHWGNRPTKQARSYEVVHAEILMKLTDDFKSTQEIWEQMEKKYNINTILSHLRILAMEGRAVWRKNETIKEWRRAFLFCGKENLGKEKRPEER